MSFGAHSACDAAQAQGEGPSSGGVGRPWVLVTTILASSLSFVDGSVVNVGLPAISRDLQGRPADLQWVVNGYLLPLSALLLLGGALGDRFGRRTLLIIGVVIFAVASAVCAMAGDLPALIAARGLQGSGAALLMPNSLAILGASYSGEARGRAVGLWAATGSMTAALGPVLGGALIDSIGWRSIFLLNVPLAVAAIVLALRFVAKAPSPERPAALDLEGAALATAALGCLAWGLTVGSGPAGWSALAATAVFGGAALMIGFVVYEGRLGDAAMMPLALFGSRSFIGLSLLTLLLYAALGGLLVLLPYLLIRAYGFSSTAAGASLAPFALILTVLSPAMGGLAGRVGPRLPLTVGPAIVGLGFLLTLRLGVHPRYVTEVLPAIIVISAGMAGAAAPLTTAVLASVDGRHTGSASGLNSALARTGGLMATALLGTMLAAAGTTLLADVRRAALVGAGLSFCAGLAAFLLLGDLKQDKLPAPAGTPPRR